MVTVILIALVVAAVGLVLYIASRPDSFRVERSATIEAPAEEVFSLINDFHNWPTWSPWEKMDPAMKRAHSGAASGVGSVYAWEGNNKVVFTLVPKGELTEVTWAMNGPSPYITKVIQVFCDMDGMIGQLFESGLANLKAVTEK